MARRWLVISFLMTFTLPAFAGLRTDDLLLGLDPAIRAEILKEADEETICDLRVAEKDLKIPFTSGTPSSDPMKPEAKLPCSDGVKIDARISSAETLKDNVKRNSWLWSTAGKCEYKKQYAYALARASRKLKANKLATFPGAGGALCVLDRQFWEPIPATRTTNFKDVYCNLRNAEPAGAMECFYDKACVLDCGAGQVALANLGFYELFAGSDGVMDETERALFNRMYPNIEIAAYGPDGIENRPGGVAGFSKNTKLTAVGKDSFYGEYALTGYRISLSTPPLTPQQSYLFRKYGSKTREQNEEDYRNGRISKAEVDQYNKERLYNAADVNSNAIVIKTSKAAAASLLNGYLSTSKGDGFSEKFQEDATALGNAMSRMNYSNPVPSDPNAWKPYEQMINMNNAAAIAAGTYVLRNATADDQKAYAEIVRIVSQPVYRDTLISIYPTGTLTLAAAVLNKKAYHLEKPVSFQSYRTNEVDDMSLFVRSRVEACLGRPDKRLPPVK